MSHEIQADYTSGSVLYAIIRDRTGQVWYPAGQVFEEWGAGGHLIDDYDVALTDKSGSRYIGSFDTGIPGGCYGVQIFRQAGASPADSDVVVCSREILWTGTGELTTAKLLANKAIQDKVTGAIEYYDDDGQTVLLTLIPCDEEMMITRMPE